MSMVTGSANMREIVAGTHTTVTASDIVQTNLSCIVYAVAVMESDPRVTANAVTLVVRPQALYPGQLLVNTWQPTATNDATPIAATAFGTIIHWIAIGC